MDTLNKDEAMTDFPLEIRNEKDNYSYEMHENDLIMNEPYLQSLPQAEPITLLQFQKILHPDVVVYIKPNNHKLYWSGRAMYIPKEMYDWKVRDISLRKRNEEEIWENGAISLFVDYDEIYDNISDNYELKEINEYYSTHGYSQFQKNNGDLK